MVAGYRLAVASTAKIRVKWMLGKASRVEDGRKYPSGVPGDFLRGGRACLVHAIGGGEGPAKVGESGCLHREA